MASLSFTAPRVTQEQELAERSKLTPEQLEKIETDVYGSEGIPPEEEKLDELVKAVEQILSEIPLDQKGALCEAMEKAPELVEHEAHPVKFLRAVQYDPQRAAQRMINFWETRVELFGTERAFLPMTMEGAMADDLEALKGVWQVSFNSPKPDSKGRKILCCDRMFIDPPRYDRQRLLRLIFYNAFIATRDKKTQIRGCVGIVYNHVKVFDRIFFKKWEKIIMGETLPTRICANHSVRNPPMIDFLLPVIKWFLKEDDRMKVYMHNGSSVLADLAPFGIGPECLPTSIGGDFVFREDEYVKERLEMDAIYGFKTTRTTTEG